MNSETPQDPQIDDPDSISQSQRIREILSRRSDTLDVRDIANREVRFNDVDERRALLYYRTSIEGLILELWNVFQNLDDGTGEEYLKEKDIATFQIPPPESLRHRVSDLQPGEGWPDPKTHHIVGLEWFLHNPEVITEQFTVESLNPPRQITETQSYILQWGELDDALRYLLEFIDVAGIDADLVEEEQQTKITRELLEEVDEWRQENIKD